MISPFPMVLGVVVLCLCVTLTTGGSYHLDISVPPITQEVTRVFPSWIEAFDTVKKEPRPILEQDIPPLVLKDPRNHTWPQLRYHMQGQIWRLLNWVHQLYEEPPPTTTGRPVDYSGWNHMPTVKAWWNPVLTDEEYNYYRRLGKNGKGLELMETPPPPKGTPLPLTEEQQIQQVEEFMHQIDQEGMMPLPKEDSTVAPPPPSLRGSPKATDDKVITA